MNKEEYIFNFTFPSLQKTFTLTLDKFNVYIYESVIDWLIIRLGYERTGVKKENLKIVYHNNEKEEEFTKQVWNNIRYNHISNLTACIVPIVCNETHEEEPSKKEVDKVETKSFYWRIFH